MSDLTDQERWKYYAPWLEHFDPAVRANAIICLIHQANFLLDHQITALEKAFVEGGGYSEQLATARLAERRKSESSKAMAQILLVLYVARPWSCEQPKKAKMKAGNSGDVRAIRIAKVFWKIKPITP